MHKLYIREVFEKNPEKIRNFFINAYNIADINTMYTQGVSTGHTTDGLNSSQSFRVIDVLLYVQLLESLYLVIHGRLQQNTRCISNFIITKTFCVCTKNIIFICTN